jgi:hypothetical protein
MFLVRWAWVLALAGQLAPAADSVFPYRVRGDVRLLLFWVGKDEVGGGRITVARGAEPGGAGWWEEIEVLFGTDPERLPVKVNRWGYGRERAEWKAAGGSPRIVRSVFEGFMRHTAEQSVSDVVPDQDSNGGPGLLYDAIRSEVRPGDAVAELRTFVEDQEFQWREPERLIAKYSQSIAPRQAAASKRLVNKAGLYGAPLGFLSAVSALVGQVAEAFDPGDARWRETRPSAAYVYNAKVYTMEVRKIEYAKSFRVSPNGPEAQDVATVAFRVLDARRKGAADFTITFPLRGGLRGVPLRVIYQPRWWLRLRLDFDFSRYPCPAATARSRAVGPPWEPSSQEPF